MQLAITAGLLLALSACAPLSYGSLATSTATIACDWSQTRFHAEGGWPISVESNPILGPRPAASTVDGYFVSALVANTFLWLILPRKLDWIVPTVVTGAQTWTVWGNRTTAPGFCGR